MRTTVTLDDDLFKALQQRARKENLSLKQVLNEALKAGLGRPQNSRKSARRFRVRPIASKLRPGIDPRRLNQLSDELEVDDFLASHARRAAS
jgi:hypothetical protein